MGADRVAAYREVVDLVLASGSPRRRELLTRLGVPFRVVVPDVDETPHDAEAPAALVRRLAEAKAAGVDASVVLAADTVVELDGVVLGKPTDPDDARRMLRSLSGREHAVRTGVAVRRKGELSIEVVTTTVRFVELDAAAIDRYVDSGEPVDKAGAYALQGRGGVFVESIAGSPSNVVGLPLATVARMLGLTTGR